MKRIRFNRHTIFSTVLNVAGLTLAFTVFMILMVQVMYDWRYDKCYPGHENIFRLEYSAQEEPGSYSANWSRPMITMMKDVLPQAEAIGTYVYSKGDSTPMRETGSDRSGVNIKFADCDYSLLKVFPFEFTEGDTALFSSPGMALISEKGAAKIFGKESPVGKELEFSSSTLVRYFPKRFTIAGVYRDFPENSSMDREILVNLGNISINNTGEWAYYCYVKTSDRDGLQSVMDSLAYRMSNGNEKADFRLMPLHEAYYSHNVSPDNIAKGNRPITITLFSVALLILTIAAINFINFSMASVPFRIKGINTRRVVGATRCSLIWTQLGTALLLVLTAFILSTGVMSIIANTSIASYISGSLRVQDNPSVLLIGLGAAALTALAAGIFRPATVPPSTLQWFLRDPFPSRPEAGICVLPS